MNDAVLFTKDELGLLLELLNVATDAYDAEKVEIPLPLATVGIKVLALYLLGPVK